MIRRPPRSTHCISSAASDVYKRQYIYCVGMFIITSFQINKQNKQKNIKIKIKYISKKLLNKFFVIDGFDRNRNLINFHFSLLFKLIWAGLFLSLFFLFFHK
eukprot:TRINITY_DN4215_c0_g1_i1.p2 TRINITY_DN4215_c0_g1~~TRINITY_DN4215_c0_g1_i1.p2  ORF type:complete len:102 (+),score=25.76 TRINITY_DN4215_c0_g1_i1:143-448(+)